MELSPAFCRIQENAQRNRAANSALENVRIVADNAAKAWGAAALSAQKREERHERVRVIASNASLTVKSAPNEDDMLFSENPDRGCFKI